jgi:hypothetical protein
MARMAHQAVEQPELPTSHHLICLGAISKLVIIGIKHSTSPQGSRRAAS